MTLRTLCLNGFLVLGLLALAGCVPSVQSQSDEEKESHFLAGKSRVSTMDYKGAVDSFEKALEVNPHSASAHFELGCLFDQREADPAAAIYHYEKYLKLRSDAGNSDVVKLRINTCKQELARNVNIGPLSERQQREIQQLAERNKALEAEIKRVSELVENWKNYVASLQRATNGLSVAQPRLNPELQPSLASSNPTRTAPGNVAVSNRTHTVKSGETLAGIARKYGLRVDTLSAANPKVDPRRLAVGTVLQVPGS